MEYLRSTGTVSTLGLWGRSMGAVTALLYSQRDPSIAGVVRNLGTLGILTGWQALNDHCCLGLSQQSDKEALCAALRLHATSFCRVAQVVDSPFSRLTDLMMEIVEEQKLPIPRPFFKVGTPTIMHGD